MKRRSKALLLVLFLSASVAAFAVEPSFHSLVKRIESHYGTRQTHIPFFGLANAFVKVARPAGASHLNLAIFENLPAPAGPDQDDFHSLIARELGPGWKPLVRVHARRDSESTSIYSRNAGRDIRLLIAVRESGQATLVEMQVTEQLLAQWLTNPRKMGDCIVVKNDKEAPDCDQE